MKMRRRKKKTFRTLTVYFGKLVSYFRTAACYVSSHSCRRKITNYQFWQIVGESRKCRWAGEVALVSTENISRLITVKIKRISFALIPWNAFLFSLATRLSAWWIELSSDCVKLRWIESEIKTQKPCEVRRMPESALPHFPPFRKMCIRQNTDEKIKFKIILVHARNERRMKHERWFKLDSNKMLVV